MAIPIESAATLRWQRLAANRVPRVNGKWVLRRTFVQNFLACGAYSDTRSEEAAAGSYFHELFATYTLTCKAHREDSMLGEVDRIAREVWFRGPRGLPQSRLEEGRKLLWRFARSHIIDLRRLQRVEYTLTHDIGWAILTGTVDAEYREDDDDADDPMRIARIVDYKTPWGVGDHDWQMRFYVCLRFLQPRSQALEEVHVDIDYPRLNIEPIHDEYHRDDFEHGELGEWWRDEVLRPLEAAWPGRRRSKPTGGTACTYCAKRLTCASAEGEAAARPTNDEEFLAFFGHVLRREAELEELRKVFRAYWRSRDPGVVLGHDVGYLLPKEAQEELVVLPGRDEEIVDYMNEVSRGAGELVRRQGVSPKLIDEPWWARLVDLGLARVQEKRRTPGWRKHIEAGPTSDETDIGEGDAYAAGPPDSTVRVVQGGL